MVMTFTAQPLLWKGLQPWAGKCAVSTTSENWKPYENDKRKNSVSSAKDLTCLQLFDPCVKVLNNRVKCEELETEVCFKWLLHMLYNSMPLLVSPTFNIVEFPSSIAATFINLRSEFSFFISLLCRPWSVLPFTWCGLKWTLSIRRQMRFLFQNIKHLHYIPAFIVYHLLSQWCHTDTAPAQLHNHICLINREFLSVMLFPTLLSSGFTLVPSWFHLFILLSTLLSMSLPLISPVAGFQHFSEHAFLPGVHTNMYMG